MGGVSKHIRMLFSSICCSREVYQMFILIITLSCLFYGGLIICSAEV